MEERCFMNHLRTMEGKKKYDNSNITTQAIGEKLLAVAGRLRVSLS